MNQTRRVNFLNFYCFYQQRYWKRPNCITWSNQGHNFEGGVVKSINLLQPIQLLVVKSPDLTISFPALTSILTRAQKGNLEKTNLTEIRFSLMVNRFSVRIPRRKFNQTSKIKAHGDPLRVTHNRVLCSRFEIIRSSNSAQKFRKFSKNSIDSPSANQTVSWATTLITFNIW